MAVMYCSGEFLFDGCNRVSSLIPIFVPRHPCRPPGASGSLFSSESLIHVTSSSSPPLSPDVTRRPCKDTLTLRVYFLPYALTKIYSVKDTLSRPSRACLFFCLISFLLDIIVWLRSRSWILEANCNSTLCIKCNERCLQVFQRAHYASHDEILYKKKLLQYFTSK